MKILLSVAVLPCVILSASPVRAENGCLNIEEIARKYVAENYPAEEGQPSNAEYRTLRVTFKVNAIQLTLRDAENKENPPQQFAIFFNGGCEPAYQADGELTQTIDAGATKYVFVRTEDNTAEERHANFQVLTVRADGQVSATQDQHGQEIYFSHTVQNRCEGRVGEVTHYARDGADKNHVTLRQQHIDRDGKCRIIEDSSTYRYYRLTPERWELDDGDSETPVAVEKRY